MENLKCQLTYQTELCYAVYQDNVPIVSEVVLTNESNTPLENLQITLSIDNIGSSIFQKLVDHIAAHESLHIVEYLHTLSIEQNALKQCTERMDTALRLTISDATGATIHSELYPIALLPYDYYLPNANKPERLAALVTPEHPALVAILQKASYTLFQWTGNGAFDGYQSGDPNRVRKMVAAVYYAIAQEQLMYSPLPPNYEQNGLRLRMCDSLFSQRKANSVELSILLAACLEAINLHPLILQLPYHALVGVWLVESTFPNCVIDDATFISKLSSEGINNIELVETTLMLKDRYADFNASVNAARQRIASRSQLTCIDIKRYRLISVPPASQSISNEMDVVIAASQKEKLSELPPDELRTVAVAEDKPTVGDKQAVWERKLLDLSLRNPLVNTRVTRNMLPLHAVNLPELEDRLADRYEFTLLPQPEEWEANGLGEDFFCTQSTDSPITLLANNELKACRLYTRYKATELSTAIVHIFRAARTSMEENGANTLYLALGMLRWYESEASEVARYAPVVLIPVELVKKSSRQGYVLRSRDEDSLINITLLEKLRQDFGINISGLDPLPRDEHGLDIPLIYSTIRRAILEQRGWDIVEVALVGLFAFSKFVMWNDLHNNAHKLAHNKVVQSLLAQQNVGIESLADEGGYSSYNPEDIALPVSADGYQLEAVMVATAGKSFILHGPPGTGKSQTITNIIANALFHGQKVLFVAEKMAALSVVQKRLNQIGLEPFCLELFSNKSSKTEVLRQLQTSADIAQYQRVENYTAEAERLRTLRQELADFVTLMHERQSVGCSLYDAISRYMHLAEQFATLPTGFTIEHPQNLSAEAFAALESNLEKLQDTVNVCEGIANHSLRGVGRVDYTPLLEQRIIEQLSAILQLLEHLHPLYKQISAQLLGGVALCNKQSQEAFNQLISTLLKGKEVLLGVLRAHEPQKAYLAAIKLALQGKGWMKIRNRILSHYDPRILEEDILALERNWFEIRNKWLLPRIFATQKFCKQISFYRLQHAPVSSTEVSGLLDDLHTYHAETNALTRLSNELEQYLGTFWAQENTDWKTLSSALQTTEAVLALLSNFTSASLPLAQLSATLANGLADGLSNCLLQNHATWQNYIDAYQEFVALESAFYALLPHNSLDEITDYIACAHEFYERLHSNVSKLRDWENWLEQRDLIADKGYKSFVQGIETGQIPPALLKERFLCVFYHTVILEVVSNHPQLAHFNSSLFEQEIERFRRQHELFEKYTQLELFARLAASLPAMQTDANSNSELGFLRRNLRNNGRGVPLRKLFEGLPTLLPRLKPCMLMSPISVAQYIDLDAMKFDLVIFDEASQLPTCEAIGAIARGKNVIVVGDPKQMPPTSFFVSNKEDEDNLELEDLESILDDCLALPLPSRYLLCHYRSKHESLIAFSNARFYENRLLSFPSPDDRISKVTLKLVEGTYDRGKSRTNIEEAKAVVSAAIAHLENPTTRTQSLGIVTFSVPQQNLVEDLLSAAFAEHPELETLDTQSSEPIFVKNLENVQGDERDVIFFSVGYGADATGYISHNFGPLNQKGGWRRLNVAITRARYAMVIYSTLRYDQIDLKRTQAEGAIALRAFLEFAAKGTNILKEAEELKDPEARRATLVGQIASILQERGHKLDTNVGCSDYRVDLAIIDETRSGEYLLGILCDGENYERAKTVTDREITHPKILGLLGWKILRIWALDWFHNREETIQKIEEAIANARAKNNEYKPTELVTPPPMPEVKIITVDATQKAESAQISYSEAVLTPVELPNEEIFNPSYKRKILTQIQQVVNKEAPVHKEYVMRKVIAAWGIARIGSKLSAYFDKLFEDLNYPEKVYEKDVFLWLPDQAPSNQATYRVFHNQPNYIAPEEIAVAVREIITQQVALPHDALLREVAHRFGFNRLGANVVVAIERGVVLNTKHKE